MGMYEIIIGVGTIFFLGLIFGILLTPFGQVVDVFTGISTDSEAIKHYGLAENIFYFVFFFLTIVIVAWIIKTSMKHQEKGVTYE